MASLFISYFSGVDNYCASGPQSSEVVTTSDTSAQGAVNANGAAVARLFSDTAHWVEIGDNPTATETNGFYLPANVLYDVDMSGLTGRIAAITA